MAEQTAETLNFWGDNFWAKNLAPWHKSDPDEYLIKFEQRLFEGGRKRILLPLCGKSVDLKWLYDRGYEVVGVEGIPEAIEQFFTEAGIEYSKSEFEGSGSIYQTLDKRLAIVQANFFELGSTYQGYFDCVWVIKSNSDSN